MNRWDPAGLPPLLRISHCTIGSKETEGFIHKPNLADIRSGKNYRSCLYPETRCFKLTRMQTGCRFCPVRPVAEAGRDPVIYRVWSGIFIPDIVPS
jgi:hypothetical protein